jgi:crotonobetainyl-CoA:carnitine CoA-transferase CaiB-like acyl-CoA transferase
MAFGYLASIDEALHSPQHAQRDFFVDLEHPATGMQMYCDAPFRMSATPWCMARAPLLGEHNEEIFSECVGLSLAEIRQLKDQGVI